MEKIKRIFCGFNLFYLTIYIPIALMTYIPQWYSFNCHLHPNCNFIGYSNALKCIDELTDFFLHMNPLSTDWTTKEKLHLAEVREILDIMALVAILCVILLVITFKRSRISTYALINIVIILSLLLLIPFFKTFWVKIFHPIFFDNNLWRTDYLDRSFYIMPGIFFKYSMIFLITVSSILNACVWLCFKKWKYIS
jgi:uncharacterized membrane protein